MAFTCCSFRVSFLTIMVNALLPRINPFATKHSTQLFNDTPSCLRFNSTNCIVSVFSWATIYHPRSFSAATVACSSRTKRQACQSAHYMSSNNNHNCYIRIAAITCPSSTHLHMCPGPAEWSQLSTSGRLLNGRIAKEQRVS